MFTVPVRGRNVWCGPAQGTKDPLASDVLYVKALAAPFTIDTMPEATLRALAKQSELGEIMAADGGDCEEVLAEFAKAGIDIEALAARLQGEGAKSFTKSWNALRVPPKITIFSEGWPQNGAPPTFQ